MPQTNSRPASAASGSGDIVAIQRIVVGDAQGLEAHSLGIVHQLRGRG